MTTSILHLNKSHQAVLLQQQGYTQVEVGQILGVSKSTAGNLIWYGKHHPIAQRSSRVRLKPLPLDEAMCKSCNTVLPVEQFHRTYTILKSGEKRYYLPVKCRSCEYEASKHQKRKYYLENKNQQHSSEITKLWRAKQKKRKRCQGCATQLKVPSQLCLACYVQHWICTTVRNLKRNRVKTLPEQAIQARVSILRENKTILMQLPGAQGYPNNKLGHKISVGKNPQGALLATNIQWMKHKPRGTYKDKDVQFIHVEN